MPLKKKERLTNTVQFQHKRITNPTISHADKVMYAIQMVIKEIKKLGGIANSQVARDLQRLVNNANNHLQSTELLDTQPIPRVNHKQRTNDAATQRTHHHTFTSKGDAIRNAE